MVDVAKNLLAIKAQLPEGVELTAVSKFLVPSFGSSLRKRRIPPSLT